jgi:regulator of sirC expression with transglutaminase-like and TPR domain
MTSSLIADFESVIAGPIDLARVALVIARIEYPDLEPGPSLDALDRLGDGASARLDGAGRSIRSRVAALNAFVFGEERFAGNRAHYADFRNSLLNVVLGRRLGIPITLALVYIEIARRAGLEVQGIAFPGHFLMRVPLGARGPNLRALVLDPFSGGAELDDAGCRRLLGADLGSAGDEGRLDPDLLNPCTPRQMLARLLNNLKRIYVDLRSFPQAHAVTDLLLALDPMLHTERRDRGLLAYHLDNYVGALRDLEDYLRLNSWSASARGERDEHDQIWEHVKTLRRRVAGLN